MDYKFEKNNIKHEQERLENDNQKHFENLVIVMIIGVLSISAMFFYPVLAVIPFAISLTSGFIYGNITKANFKKLVELEKRYEEITNLENQEVKKEDIEIEPILYNRIDEEIEKVKIKSLKR